MNLRRSTILALAIASLFAGHALADAEILDSEPALLLSDASSGSIARALAFAGTPDMLGNAHLSRFLAMEMGDGGKVVKDAPYSAEAVSETTQFLADGNRISRKTATLLFRDALGRTRQEQTAPGSTVFINDPVSGKRTILNADRKTATVLPDFGSLMHIDSGKLAKLSELAKAHVIRKSADGEMQIMRKSADGNTDIVEKSGA
ncbi:MAG: hypothetical protein ABI831_09485, partial [Betaproteobacteria bacterium]